MVTGREAGAIVGVLLMVVAATIGGVSLIGTTAAQSGGSTTSVSVGSGQGQPGDEVTVLVRANASNVTSAEVNISFDPSVAEVQSVSSGDLGAPTARLNNNQGFVSFTVTDIGNPTDNPVLASVTFEVVAGSATNTTLDFIEANTTLRNATGDEIAIDAYENGTITAIPSIYVPSYTVSATTVERNEPFFVNATVQNNQNVSDSLNVTLYKDGVAAVSRNVTVAAGASTVVSFNTSFAKAGSHTVAINDRDPTSISVLVEKIGVFDFTVPKRVSTNESFVVNASVQNNQQVADSLNVTLYKDGVANRTKNVSVPANSTKSVTFTTSFATEGKHNVSVNEVGPKTVDVFGPARITLGNVSAGFGERVTLNLSTNAARVKGYEANVSFDPSLIRVRSVSGADFSAPTVNIDNEDGFVSLTQTRSGSGIDRPTFARITVEIVATSPTTAPLSFVTADTAMFNGTGSNIPISAYEAGAVTVEPGIVVTDYAVSNTTVTVGEQFFANATVRNYAGSSKSLNVRLFVDGKVATNQTVTVAGNSVKTANLSTSFAAAGTRQVRVNNRPSTAITVRVGTIGVTGFTVSNDEPLVNESFFVNATVENGQATSDSLNVTLYKDGVASQTKTVTVPGQSNETVVFETNFTERGPHNVTVNDQPAKNVTAVGPTVVAITDVRGGFDETVTLEVRLQGRNLGGAETNISFDPSVVRVQGVSAVDFDSATANIDNRNGTILLTASGSTPRTDPVAAKITAKIVASRPTSTAFTLRPSDTLVFNGSGSSVSIDRLENGSVTVEPGIIATNFTLSNRSVGINQPFTVNATVRNFKSTAASLDVKLFSDGTVVKNRTVNVAANTTAFVEFNYSYATAGRRAVRINTLAPKRVTVTPGTIGIIDVTYSKTDVDVNETFAVNVTIQNNQATQDTLALTLFKAGTAAETRNVTVNANSERTVTFRTSFDRGGRFNVTVNNQPPQSITVRGGVTAVIEDVETSTGLNTFTVAVYVNVSAATGFETTLTFDPTLLQATSFTRTLPNGISNIDNANGTIRFTSSGVSDRTDPVFARITFQINASTPTNTTIGFVPSRTGLFDVNSNPIPIALYDNSTVAVRGFKPGDVTGDRVVDTGDVIQIQRLIVGLRSKSGFPTEAADVVDDGVIDTGDVIQIQRFIVGLRSSL